jgi:hypothetical protein
MKKKILDLTEAGIKGLVSQLNAAMARAKKLMGATTKTNRVQLGKTMDLINELESKIKKIKKQGKSPAPAKKALEKVKELSTKARVNTTGSETKGIIEAALAAPSKRKGADNIKKATKVQRNVAKANLWTAAKSVAGTTVLASLIGASEYNKLTAAQKKKLKEAKTQAQFDTLVRLVVEENKKKVKVPPKKPKVIDKLGKVVNIPPKKPKEIDELMGGGMVKKSYGTKYNVGGAVAGKVYGSVDNRRRR